MTADRGSPRHPSFDDALKDLACLGVSPCSPSRSAVSCFGIVSARSNPRWWLIPFSTPALLSCGLNLFHPITRSATAAKKIAQTKKLAWLVRLSVRNRIHLCGIENAAKLFPGGSAHCAFFTGTTSPHRKTTIQFMDQFGAIVGYGKLSRSSVVQTLLRAEADALHRLESFKQSSFDAPRLLACTSINGALLLITDSRKTPHFSSPTGFGKQHEAFIYDLERQTMGGSWQEYLRRIRTQLEVSCNILDLSWSARLGRCIECLTLTISLFSR